tara:strand:- start:4404 stop:4526 length:123 start_codon:yes stop_codon:yes gene_type:complete
MDKIITFFKNLFKKKKKNTVLKKKLKQLDKLNQRDPFIYK